MNKLLNILSYNRRHNSPGEQFIINKYITPLNPIVFSNDNNEPMAYAVVVGHFTGILWSCHTDTVHAATASLTHKISRNIIAPASITNSNPRYKSESLSLTYKDDTNCFGADDGAGMWLLLEMIEAGVPGTYIFHRGEECGGIGSNYMAKYEAEFLSQFTHAIAFDRKGTNSIITHQLGRCCSDGFAKEFGDYLYNLSDTLINLRLDDTGLFTDTANYVEIIPECTNISIGYYNEHTSVEWLNINYLQTLRDTMIKFGNITLTVYQSPIEPFDPYDYYKIDSIPVLQTEADIRDLVYNNPEDAIKLISYYTI